MAFALRLLRRRVPCSRDDVQRGIGVVDPDGDIGAGVPIGLRRGINGGSLLRRPRHDKHGF